MAATTSMCPDHEGAYAEWLAGLSVSDDIVPGRQIVRYDVTADLDADGLVHATIDFDFDFGDEPGHGPYLTLVTRQPYDASRTRVYSYTDFAASSPSGAPAQINRTDDADSIMLKIGDPDIGNVTGVQRYIVTYTAHGWVNPANSQHVGDELNWNVVGTGWSIPLSHLALTVTGPDRATDAVCFAGPMGSTTVCTSVQTSGTGARFTQDHLDAGEGWTTVTGWPGGTFDTEPILEG